MNRVVRPIKLLSQEAQTTPAPRQVRVMGILDQMNPSTQMFVVRLADGQEVCGQLTDGSAEELVALLKQAVLVCGQAFFLPSGRLLRLEVTSFRAATHADHFFGQMPKPLGTSQANLSPQVQKQNAEALRNAIGKWPGDESDEEVAAALKELG